MSWVAVAVGAGSLIAGVVGSKNAKKAASAQSASADKASEVQWDMYNQNRTDMEPWRQAGLTGLNEYMSLLGLPTSLVQAATAASGHPSMNADEAYLAANPDVARDPYYASRPWEHYVRFGKSEGRGWGLQATPAATAAPASPTDRAAAQQTAFANFRATPGYQFGLDEGQKTLQSSAAAAGGLFSGKAGKALVKFGTDYADQQGFQPYANRLAGLAGIGQAATGTTGAYGQNTANNVGSNLLSAGQARASGINGQTQAWQGALGGLGTAAGYWLGNR